MLKCFLSKKAKDFLTHGIGIDKVFINKSLCHYCKFLWSKCKTLWSEEQIETFWVSNDQIRINQITYITDLQKLFPSYDFWFK